MSSDLAISFRGVGKRYRIGSASGQRYSYNSLGERIAGVLRNPFRAAVDAVRSGDDAAFWALKDVSFDVPRGEVVGVIGRNGAGKSTLLKVLSQITRPTEGEIEVRGRVGSLLEVGTGFHPELSGRENVFLNGAILGMTRQEVKRKFDEIVAFSEIERFLDTPVKQYSSGMYTRLAFAVAAHLDPEILVVDEVLAVGDAEFQKKCLGKMQEVSRGGRTILFVSHNIASIRKLCTSAALLEQGTLTTYDTVDAATALYIQSTSADDTNTLNVEYKSEAIKLHSVTSNYEHTDDDNFTVLITFDAKQSIDLGFSLEIYADATLVSRLMPNVTNCKVSAREGASSVRITLPAPSKYLCLGKYNISLGIHEVGVAELLRIDQCATLLVRHNSRYSGTIDPTYPMHGVATLPIRLESV